jgi:uncharacterized protein (DUF2384 family)
MELNMPTKKMPAPNARALPEALRILDRHRFDSKKRKRLGGPGLRTFLNIADEWRLSEQQRRRVLGLPARSTFYDWLKKARRGDSVTLTVDELTRISAVLGIYKALKIIFSHDEDAAKWLRSPNRGIMFGGQEPLSLITSGTQDALISVRRYLDAWRGGTFAEPVPGFDEIVAPMTEDDLVFA